MYNSKFIKLVSLEMFSLIEENFMMGVGEEIWVKQMSLEKKLSVELWPETIPRSQRKESQILIVP